MKSLNPKCPSCSSKIFQLRALKNEGIALATCVQCDCNYLILDSEDYWFDVIQARYPRQSRCSCKSDSFQLRFDYSYRDDGEINEVEVWSICSKCSKMNRQMSMDIDYGGTEVLWAKPLKYCKNPNVKFDLKELTLYITSDDMAQIVDYLRAEVDCQILGWILEKDEWVQKHLTLQAAMKLIRGSRSWDEVNRYLMFYVAINPIRVAESVIKTTKAESAYWKRHDIIRISSPTHMILNSDRFEESLLYYISFSNEYVADDKVVKKSSEFREATGKLLDWLKTKFVSWRGPLAFDNPDEHRRAFGTRFMK